MEIADLSKEFPRETVHWRAQTLTRNGEKALALAYIDARHVMDRLDEVCGPENWQSEFTETAKGRVICRIGILIGDGWVWKSDGAGNTDVEGEKGGISDALKRAAVHWGIGRYLYRLDAVWAACETYDKNGKLVWSKWKGSPWDFVRGNSNPPPSGKANTGEQPKFDPAAARDRIKKTLTDSPTLEKLGKRWTAEQHGIAEVRAASEPMFNELVKAKDDRKADLAKLLTNQGAG